MSPSPIEAPRAFVTATQAKHSLERRLWGRAGAVLAGAFALFIVYVRALDGPLTFASLAKGIAGTASIGLALSFALSSIGYYWDAFDRHVVLRKYFGLLGYFFAVLYAFCLWFIDPDFYFYGFFRNFWTPDIALGFFSLGILTIMALISHDKATRWLGPARWRVMLRFGYLAYFLLVLRAIAVESDLWEAWFRDPIVLPHVRLLLSLIAITVIFCRLSIIFSKYRNNRRTPVAVISTP